MMLNASGTKESAKKYPKNLRILFFIQLKYHLVLALKPYCCNNISSDDLGVNCFMMKIGTILTLETNDDSEDVQRFRCRVVEQKGSSLYIDYPINTQTDRTDFFPNGTFLFAYFVGNDQSIYKFYTEIIARKREKVPMLMLRYDQNKLTKIQRREYVRVDANLDVSITDPEGDGEVFTTVTKDISGGGLAVILPANIEVRSGMPVDLVIVLRIKEEIDYIFTRAETIRTFELAKEAKQLLSLKFVDIYEQDRQQIIQFCFETQLKARRQALENQEETSRL